MRERRLFSKGEKGTSLKQERAENAYVKEMEKETSSLKGVRGIIRMASGYDGHISCDVKG